MTPEDALALAGCSRQTLQRHRCQLCETSLWQSLVKGCQSKGPKCDPQKKPIYPWGRDRGTLQRYQQGYSYIEGHHIKTLYFDDLPRIAERLRKLETEGKKT